MTSSYSQHQIDALKERVAELEAAGLKMCESFERELPEVEERIAELEAALIEAERDWEQERRNFRELEATIKRVSAEVNNVDQAFNHPDSTSHEAYRNIRSIVECLRKALEK